MESLWNQIVERSGADAEDIVLSWASRIFPGGDGPWATGVNAGGDVVATKRLRGGVVSDSEDDAADMVLTGVACGPDASATHRRCVGGSGSRCLGGAFGGQLPSRSRGWLRRPRCLLAGPQRRPKEDDRTPGPPSSDTT